MCVIIITNKDNPIEKEELIAAWDVNPDGAGVAYTAHGINHFKRGFMQFEDYWKAVSKLQTKYELLLHLRISTSAGINPQGTHPYKAGSLLKMGGRTRRPLIAMNGVIYAQPLHKKHGVKLNDTASYIKEHGGAFKKLNSDILEIIADATAAKWAAVTTSGIITAGGFKSYNGRLYSNLNHVHRTSTAATCSTFKSFIELEDMLTDSAYNVLYPNWELWDILSEYVEFNCKYWRCSECSGCISDITTTKDARNFLRSNGYSTSYYEF